MRSLGSVPMAENMSANLATCSRFFLACAGPIFRYLQKYRSTVKSGKETAQPQGLKPGRFQSFYETTEVVPLPGLLADLSVSWLKLVLLGVSLAGEPSISGFAIEIGSGAVIESGVDIDPYLSVRVAQI